VIRRGRGTRSLMGGLSSRVRSWLGTGPPVWVHECFDEIIILRGRNGCDETGWTMLCRIMIFDGMTDFE
jgi:hypothetical protein